MACFAIITIINSENLEYFTNAFSRWLLENVTAFLNAARKIAERNVKGLQRGGKKFHFKLKLNKKEIWIKNLE